MAAKIRALISQYNQGDLSETAITNTMHFENTVPALFLPTDWNDLAEDICTAWRVGLTHTLNRTEVRLYELDDEKPRPARATVVQENTGTLSESGPREVALCLSFHDGTNQPRHRGRVYIGPWPKSTMDMRPAATHANQLLNLGAAMANIGGINIQWCVYSVADDELRQVQHLWVDNEWDTVRRRGLTALSRESLTMEG